MIVVFCAGAVSHVDFWEHKPELIRQHGKPLPGNERLISFQGENGTLQRPLDFVPRGDCGKMIHNVPHIGSCVDDIASCIRSTQNPAPGPAENLMSTGFNREGHQRMGACYFGLGTENQNLPLSAIEDPRGTPQSGSNNWTSGFYLLPFRVRLSAQPTYPTSQFP